MLIWLVTIIGSMNNTSIMSNSSTTVENENPNVQEKYLVTIPDMTRGHLGGRVS